MSAAHFMPFGAWPYLVKRGGLEVLHRSPVYERVMKTSLFLRGSLSLSLAEVPALSTSPNMAKNPVYIAKRSKRLICRAASACRGPCARR
jgi:hypothetical protein